MFSEIFIKRPKFAIVIAIVMVIAGSICGVKLPIAEYPEIAPVTIQVETTYTGAGSQVVSETIAAPLEAEMNGLENLQYFSSNSDNNGGYRLSLIFKSGTDSDINMVNVQNALKRVERQLPTDVVNQGIQVKKRSSDILGFFSFRSSSPDMTNLALSNYVKTRVKDELARVPGISAVNIMAAKDYSMRVWLDTLRMSALDISPEDVQKAIKSQNIQAAAGAIGTEGSPSHIQFKVNVTGRLKTVDEFSNIIVKSTPDGAVIRLNDIARIELGAESYTGSSRNDGQPAVNLAVYRNADSNALEAMNGIKAELERLSKKFPEGMEYIVSYDPTEYITATMAEISMTLIVALVLVIAITYIFLQDWRATLIPALAIPVSLLATFAVLLPLGYSINVLTMFGLILVIGSLVDDGIVVVENTVRIMETEHLSAKEATRKSMKQITGAIIATTLVTVAIYVPIGFFGGMVGNIYRQFSVTMCVALCFSTINALTLSPALCSLLLKERKPGQKRIGLFTPFNKSLDWSRKLYLTISGFFVRHAWLTIIALITLLALNWQLFTTTKTSFLPKEDKGTIFCEIQLPPGATLARTESTLREAEQLLLGLKGVKQVTSVSGFSFMGGNGENLGMCIARLDPWEQRTTPDLSIDAIMAEAIKQTHGLASAKATVFTPPAIMGLGLTGGVSFRLLAQGDETPKDLEREVQSLCQQISQMPGVFRAFSSYEANTPQLFLNVDRSKAESMKVPTNRIFTTLQGKLASIYINDFNMEGYTFKVKMQADPKDRSNIYDIMNTYIQNDEGNMVPLSSFATLSYMVGPRLIQRFNQSMSAEISVPLKPDGSSGNIMKAIEQLELPANYEIQWTDMSYEEKNNEGEIAVLMALAIVFGYLFLVAQYESWTIPMSVISSVCVATLGALVGLTICEIPLSIYAQLGLIMLIGLASKNAILMVEFSKDQRQQGATIHFSALEGAKQRFRAVLMTAISFIIGVFPMVIATGAGAASRQHIGITTFAGMIAATLFGIILIPGLYSIFQRFREWGKGNKA